MTELQRYTTYLTAANKEKLERYAKDFNTSTRTLLNMLIQGLNTRGVDMLLFGGVNSLERPIWTASVSLDARVIWRVQNTRQRGAMDAARAWLQQKRESGDSSTYKLSLIQAAKAHTIAVECYTAKGLLWRRDIG